jgi:hypothetical protein
MTFVGLGFSPAASLAYANGRGHGTTLRTTGPLYPRGRVREQPLEIDCKRINSTINIEPNVQLDLWKDLFENLRG